MLCYRCGSHVPDSAESCANCGQKLSSGGVRQATGTFSRRKGGGQHIDGAPFQAGEVIASRYTVKDVLGQGPLGFVFRVQDKEGETEVALKVINARLVQTAEERRQFQKALRLARKLSHQNLLRVYEEGEDAERPFYTMQLVEGLSLRKIIDLRLSKGQLFSVKEVEPIFAQMAQALESAHKLGPHSDFKPENVIVLPDLLKVADYGLGLALPRPPFVQAMKQRKADRYIAPEYLQGAELDARADIYSLGAIVAEMLSGAVPGEDVPEAGERNVEIPQLVEGLYRRALNSNPNVRPKSALEFFEEFQEVSRRQAPPPLRSKAQTAQTRRPSTTPPLQLVPKDRPPAEVSEIEPQSEEIEVTPSVVSSGTPTPSIRPPTGHLPIPTPTQIARPVEGILDDDDTALMASVPPPLAPEPVEVEPPPYRTGPSPTRKSRAGLLLGLTLSGLALGVAGGFRLLHWLEKRPVVQPVAPGAQGTPPGGGTGSQAPSLPAGGTTPSGTGTSSETGPGGTSSPSTQDSFRVAAVREAEAVRQAEEQRRKAQARAAAGRAATGDAAEGGRKPGDSEAGEGSRTRAGSSESGGRGSSGGSVAGGGAASNLPGAGTSAEETAEEVKVAKAALSPPADGEACAEGMKLVAGGPFKMGTARDDPMMGFDERVLGSVEVPSFCIDQYEYPNRRGATPAVNVSFAEAKRLCESRGRRLCTEEEWEKACKGPGNARFPYGNTFDPSACNTEDEAGEDRAVAPSGRFNKCRSGYGVADLSGNVAEWTSSIYAGNADRAQKGGASSRPDYASRCSARKNGAPGSKAPEVGFRCCADSSG